MPRTELLQASDIQRLLSERQLPRRPQLAGSRILWVDPERCKLWSFDLQGELVGKAALDYSEAAEKRFISPLRPLQDDVLLAGQNAYLSMRGRIHIWDLPSGELVQTVRFGRPVRLIKPLPEGRLIVASPNANSLMMIADLDGNVVSRFGSKLVLPRHPANDGFNGFFALDAGDRIVVIFQMYPVFHVYDLDGDLIDSGEYELGRPLDDNPPLGDVAKAETAFDSQYELLSLAEYNEGHIYWAAGDARAGILDEGFRLVHSRAISDFKQGFVPKVLAIDAPRERLLVRERLPDAAGRLSRFGEIGYIPIRKEE